MMSREYCDICGDEHGIAYDCKSDHSNPINTRRPKTKNTKRVKITEYTSLDLSPKEINIAIQNLKEAQTKG